MAHLSFRVKRIAIPISKRPLDQHEQPCGRENILKLLLPEGDVSLSHSVTEQLSPYIEGYWFSRQDPDGGRVLSVDAGLIQALTARLAVDGGFTVGLTNAAPHLAVFGGLSIIVGEPHPRV